VKPVAFDYHLPGSIDEALNLYTKCEDGRFLAGGQSLVPMMSLRLAAPSDIIDLNKIKELSGVYSSDDYIHIGAMTRQDQMGSDELLCEHVPIMNAVIDSVGHPGTRTRGTIGGSLCHADPAAELPALFLALDAQLVVAQAGGTTRTIAIESFFTGHFETALHSDELLTEIQIPITPKRHMGFHEITARSSDFAMAGAIASATLAASGTLDAVRVVTFGLGDRPVRLRDVEIAVANAQGDPTALRSAAQLTKDLVLPRDEIHLSANYRTRLAVAVVQRALEGALAVESGFIR